MHAAVRSVAAMTTVLSFGCTTTDRIGGDALTALQYTDPTIGTLVLEDPDGQRIRLDPRSKVRLILFDGRQTDWLPAKRLAVRDGRIFDGNRHLNIEDIETVEVENIDGVMSYFLTVGAVAVAAAVIALIVTSSKGGESKGGNATAGPVDPPPTAGEAPRYAAAGAPWFYADPWLYPPRPTFYIPLGGPRIPTRSSESAPSDTAEAPNRLFTEAAVRRSSFSPLMQFELGYGFDGRNGAGLSVGGGFAINQMFEISGGLRLSDMTDPQRLTLGYVRVGGNFPFEAANEFGAPIALDVAFGGDGFAHMRVLWGFRWRFSGRFEVAVLPANPVLSLRDDEVYWDFPSMLQVGYRF